MGGAAPGVGDRDLGGESATTWTCGDEGPESGSMRLPGEGGYDESSPVSSMSWSVSLTGERRSSSWSSPSMGGSDDELGPGPATPTPRPDMAETLDALRWPRVLNPPALRPEAMDAMDTRELARSRPPPLELALCCAAGCGRPSSGLDRSRNAGDKCARR